MLKILAKPKFNLVDLLTMAIATELLSKGLWAYSFITLFAGMSLACFLETRLRRKNAKA